MSLSLDEFYERACAVIEHYGGKPPKRDEDGSLGLIGMFCHALDVEPEIKLVKREDQDLQRDEK